LNISEISYKTKSKKKWVEEKKEEEEENWKYIAFGTLRVTDLP